jgi:energy-coupling factor transporter ATP-binding protein EcfA2
MSNPIVLPNFIMDSSTIPDVKIRSIRFQKYKAFDDVTFDFWDEDLKDCKPFVCFHGPNGCGKTTILEAITLIFSRLEGRESEHLRALLGKSVRHIDGVQRAIYNKKDDFLLTAHLKTSLGDYEVQINKTGFIKDHPNEIKDIIGRLCYYARFDQELHQFQLNRKSWKFFKDLFESVTGFKIKEQTGVFSDSSDPVQAEMLRKYVLGFMVHKPDEIISHKECSAGERKIIKSFSTLLNKEYMPEVVCIDNAEMHVESGRHIHLMESIKRCFPKSQIFTSTHSYQISKNFGAKNQLYDLRFLKASSLIKKESWRLYLSDELKESLFKLQGISCAKNEKRRYMILGEQLIQRCLTEKKSSDVVQKSEEFLARILSLYVSDIVSCFSSGKIKGNQNF